MTSPRTLFSGASASAAIAALLLLACSGEPGGSIPGGAVAAPTEAPPAATMTAAAGGMAPAPPSSGHVSLSVTVEGTGSVTSQPAGIDCAAKSGKCTATFAAGTHVTLVAAPAEGWKLDAWRGACAGGSTCSVVLGKDSIVVGSLALLDARWDPSVGAADCMSAWGTAGEKLSPCDTTKDDYVVIEKSKRNVALCTKGKLVKNLRSGLGSTPTGAKEKLGDGKTPEGVFYVPRVIPDSSYYKAFLISYPLPADAQRGVTQQLITPAERSQIESAHAACVEPPQTTALGGDLEIQGSGTVGKDSSKDWTAGNVVVENTGVDLLWSSIGVGDTIVILP